MHVIAHNVRLWSQPTASIPSNDHPRMSTPLLELYLKRSGSYPLGVTLRLSCGLSSGYDTHQLDRVLSHSTRWQRLVLRVQPRYPWHAQSFTIHNTPLLKSVTIDASNKDTQNHNNAIVVFSLPDAPALRRVSIILLSPGLVDIPWEQLSHLSLSSCLLHSTDLRIIAQSKRVQYLRFSLCWGRNLESASTLAKIIEIDRDFLMKISMSCDAPNIENLQLSSAKEGFPMVQFTHFVRLSKERIVSLRLDALYLTSSEVITILDMLPSIQVLELQAFSRMSLLFQQLHASANLASGRPSLFNVVHLRILLAEQDIAPTFGFVHLIRSRPNNRFKRLDLILNAGLDALNGPAIDIPDGIIIRVTSHIFGWIEDTDTEWTILKPQVAPV